MSARLLDVPHRVMRCSSRSGAPQRDAGWVDLTSSPSSVSRPLRSILRPPTGLVELSQQRPSAAESTSFIALEALPVANESRAVGQRTGVDAANLDNGPLAFRRLLDEFTGGGRIGLFQQSSDLGDPPACDQLR